MVTLPSLADESSSGPTDKDICKRILSTEANVLHVDFGGRARHTVVIKPEDIPDNIPRIHSSLKASLPNESVRTVDTPAMVTLSWSTPPILAGVPEDLKGLNEVLSAPPLSLNEYLNQTKMHGRFYDFEAYLAALNGGQVKPYIQNAMDKGLVSLAYSIPAGDLKTFLSEGYLKIKLVKGNESLKMVTQAQMGQDATSLIGNFQVLLLLDPRMVMGSQFIAGDIVTASPFGRQGITGSTRESLVLTLMNGDTNSVRWQDYGWEIGVSDFLELTTWGIQGIVINPKDTPAANHVRTVVEEYFSGQGQPMPPGFLTEKSIPQNLNLLPFKTPISRQQSYAISEVLSLRDPMTQDELSPLVFKGIVQSTEIADWIHLIGSDLQLKWATQQSSNEVTAKLIRVTRNPYNPGETGLILVDAESRIAWVPLQEITEINLVEYRPNVPRPGTFSIWKNHLDDPQVRAYINSDPKDLTVGTRILPEN